MTASAAKSNGQKPTIAALAKAMRLPVEHLKQLGLRDTARGVAIPYYAADGAEIAIKERTAVVAKEGSHWPKGVELAAYGSWKIGEAHKAGVLFVVKGESDCWTLWHYKRPALGIPGSNAVKVILPEHVEAVEKVYVIVEPDQGGETFRAGVSARLSALGFAGKVYELVMPDGVKDPSDLHVADPDTFLMRFQRAIATATPIALGTTTASSSNPPSKQPLFTEPIVASQLPTGGATANYIWDGYIARESVTLLTSLWKAGKTTLLALLIRSMGNGEPLAGRSVAPGNVLVIAEESARLWAARRDKLGIGDHALFDIRPFRTRPGLGDWREYTKHLADVVRRRSVSLVCIDTLSALSPCDDENDAAKMMAALNPLHNITEAGAGVLLIHHPRKGDGGEGQASRGSGALPGFVDVILEMRRARTGERGNRQRELTAYSRFDDTPPELVIELAEDGLSYQALGTFADVGRESRWRTLCELLPGKPPGLTADEALEKWPDDKAKPGRRTIDQDLKNGAEAQRWSRGGAGKKGDPFRYWSNANGQSNAEDDSFRAPIDPICARNESDDPLPDSHTIFPD